MARYMIMEEPAAATTAAAAWGVGHDQHAPSPGPGSVRAADGLRSHDKPVDRPAGELTLDCDPLRLACLPNASSPTEELLEWNQWSELLHVPNLLFCALPKNANSNWKQLLRRVQGIPDWNPNLNIATIGKASLLLHHPSHNGLAIAGKWSVALKQGESPFDAADLLARMRGSLKAVIVRDPVTRFLSAYLDKCVDCHEWSRCRTKKKASFEQVVRAHVHAHVDKWDVHFRPQAMSCGLSHVRYDEIGYFETFAESSERILRRAGLYERFGASGWGANGQAAFGVVKERAGAQVTGARPLGPRSGAGTCRQGLGHADAHHDTGSAAVVCKHYSRITLQMVRESALAVDFDAFGYRSCHWQKVCEAAGYWRTADGDSEHGDGCGAGGSDA